jgi:hypothetical protein
VSHGNPAIRLIGFWGESISTSDAKPAAGHVPPRTMCSPVSSLPCLEHASLIIVMTCHEVRIKVRCEPEIGWRKRFIPTTSQTSSINRDVGTQADKKRDRKHQQSENTKRLPKAGSLVPPGTVRPRLPRER